MKPIFDNGHGGLIAGVYQTPGKRSPNWERGVLFEGAFNRWVVNRLIEKMDRAGLPYYHASPELTDVSLGERVRRANAIHAKDKSVYFLSIHANAGGGVGIEAFTTPGRTSSDPICEAFLVNMKTDLKDLQTIRPDFTDKDHDKEERFQVLTGTTCPSLLIECGFMDNKTDYDKLWSEQYIERLVDSIFKTIVQLQKK
jgi:N-acetylmuramoyl-L-alanine amidase